jgi:lactate racemase
MTDLYVRFCHQKTPVTLPQDWQLLTFAAFAEKTAPKDAAAATSQALQNPIDSAPLSERVGPSDTVAIMVEDLTRASPKKAVLGSLLKELSAAGVPPKNISVIISLGTHRKLSKGELAEFYGAEATAKYAFINHDCKAKDLVPVGKLKIGVEVKINRRVMEASFKIGVGSIFAHPFNGFGGGGKILFPGVADFDSILAHHLKYAFREGLEIGVIKGNPFYEEIRDITKKAGLDFIVNSVLDQNDDLYEVVCGGPVNAHLAGAEICKKIISQPFQKQSDVTLISAFPYSEGPQIMKPFAPASIITKKGGCIILFADVSTPIPDILIKTAATFREKYAPNLRAAVFDHFDQNRRISKKAAPEINMALGQLLLAQDRYKIILVTKDIDKETVERLGLYHADNAEQAFEISTRFYPRADVHVVPAGGVILPVLGK